MTISMADLQRLVRDPLTPEAQLKQYFKANPKMGRAFEPAVIVNSDTVDVAEPISGVESAVLGDWANSLCQMRREIKFLARSAQGDTSPVLVSEGDSWFQFPFLLDDVIDQLADRYNIWSTDAAGDTLQNMVLDNAEYMKALQANASNVRAFLFSGAGNDIVGRDRHGKSNLSKMLRAFKPDMPAQWYIETEDVARQLRFIEDCYRQVLTNVAAEFPKLPVLCHGYDYSIPGGFPGDPRHPSYAAQDKWLGSALKGDLGIRDPALQRQIIRLLIDRLNERIRTLCGGNVQGGAFRTAWHVDARGAVATVNQWADELHPSNVGFARVAGRFRTVLGAALPAQEGAVPETVETVRSLFDVTQAWTFPFVQLGTEIVDDAKRPLARAFGFASEWIYLVEELDPHAGLSEDEPNSAFAKKAIQLLRAKYSEKPLMIGFDVGVFKPADVPDEAEEKAREATAFQGLIADLNAMGAVRSIYLEGAFGATGSRWERGEAKRFIAAALAAGLTTAAKAPKLISAGAGRVRLTPELDSLVQAWDKGGHFWHHTLEDLRTFKALGFLAAEIDNLDRPLDVRKTKAFDRRPVGLTGRLGFYRTYADEYLNGTIPVLILKNQSAPMLASIGAKLGKLGSEDDPAKLPRAMFADFHICEASDLDPDQRTEIAQASALLGIETIFSQETERYRVHGPFGAAAAVGLAAVTETHIEGPQVAEMAGAGAAVEAAGLTLTPSQRLVCERIINVFETGTPRGKVGAISIFHDGPHGIRQVTYGRAQTTEYGNLRELVEMYAGANGKYSAALRPYVSRIGVSPLVDDATFKDLLRKAGNEDPVMARTQDVFFERRYFQNAKRWADDNGFTRALSMLVIYDSFVHSGTILQFLRSRFAEAVPSKGGNEQEWIRQYVEVRHAWLRNHSNPELRPTIYRTRDLARCIAQGNWDLRQLPISANGIAVDDRPDSAPDTVVDMPRQAGIQETVFESSVANYANARSATPDAAGSYVWQGLSKEAFLKRNRSRLREELATVNAILDTKYGADSVRLTESCIWVLIYIEAGLTRGKVDPDFRHSLGERGMMPLPENIAYWNGLGAPVPNQPMQLETNLHHFFLYLGQLMNKPVLQTQRYVLYSGLFRTGSFRTDPIKQAQLLAAVVHGYFYGANYNDRRVPFDAILAGFERGEPADQVMRPTKYVHAGSSILTNRARNIAEALALLGGAGPELESVLESFPKPNLINRNASPEWPSARSSSPKRYKLKFDDKDALRAAVSGPEVAGIDAGRVDWKRNTLVVETPDTGASSVLESAGAMADVAGTVEDRVGRMAGDYGAKMVPDVQYDIDALYEAGPESEDDPTLDDVVNMIRADRVWGRARGAGVTIAVVDTGVEGSRPEFRNKVGWHRGLTAQPNLSAWSDTNGHGTMCAAIAAGEGGMGTARNGIAPEAHILPCRTTTFFDADIVRFYDELIERARNGETIVVTNSFGIKSGTAPPRGDDDLKNVLMEAEAAGIHIFFSAGNNHELTGAAHNACGPNSIWLHKSYDCLMTVGTCDLDRSLWSYSSRGPGQFYNVEPRTAAMPDVIAPTPRNGRIAFGSNDRTMTIGWGTSGACPQVAGLAALILSIEPKLRPADVRELIRSTARSIGTASSSCQGRGVIDCEVAVNRLAQSRRSPRSARAPNQPENRPGE